MQLYSTNNKENIVDLKQAVLKSLAVDKGLYMPTDIPQLDPKFIANIKDFSFQEIAFTVCANLLKDCIPANDLMGIINRAFNFPAPVVPITNKISTLELFHGPSLAFKDFGARFMAQLMSYFNRGNKDDLTILVATSGDTGGAVAAGFYNTPGIKVIILYPKGKVSEIQEKQLTTLGGNITACEIDGNFDDCQALVKTAFLDPELTKAFNLSSANSINIARLIPQSFYYFEAYKQKQTDKPLVFSVPSGNFGNITAGLFAKRMGLPIEKFIAATNVNKVVPDYLSSGTYNPIKSKETIANAMDVGNPSNFARMMELYPTHDSMTNDIQGYWYEDSVIRGKMKEVYLETNYVLDPHGAIGYLSCEDYLKSNDHELIFLETAHPCKFLPDVEKAIDTKIDLPQSIKEILNKENINNPLDNSFESFKSWMLS